jgi:hypothetical protein
MKMECIISKLRFRKKIRIFFLIFDFKILSLKTLFLNLKMVKLNFDGSNVGCIDDIIVSRYIKAEGFKTSTLKFLERVVVRSSGTRPHPGDEVPEGLEPSSPGNKSLEQTFELILYKIHREYPLVLDYVKSYFKIYRTKYNIVQIDGTRYLAYKKTVDMPLDDYISMVQESLGPLESSTLKLSYSKILKPSLVNEVRRIIALNWIMCIQSNSDSKIYVRALLPDRVKDSEVLRVIDPEITPETVVYPFTSNEKGYLTDVAGCDISEKILSKWFNGDRELFYDNIRSLTSNIDIEEFKNFLEKIINHVNPLLIPWIDVIMNRIKSIQLLE